MSGRISGAVRGVLARFGVVRNAPVQQQVMALREEVDAMRSQVGLLETLLVMQHEATSGRLDAVGAGMDARIDAAGAVAARAVASAEAVTRIAGVAGGAPPEALPPAAGPLVSIVVPAFGAAPLLARSLRSISAQTYTRFECVVVNDGSDDRVAAAFQVVAHDPRFRLLPSARLGVCGARNVGLAAGQGELFAFLDADNQWTPWHLAASVTALSDSGIDATYAAMVIERAGGIVDARSQPFDREALLQECFIDLNVLVHRRSLYQLHGGFDEDLQRLVDWDYVARLTTDATVHHLRHIGCIYDDRESDRISTTRPIGPSWYAIRSKWRGTPAAGLRVLWVGPGAAHGAEPLGAAEAAAFTALGASVQPWSPTCGSAQGLPAFIAEHRPQLVHFATANLAARYRADVRESGVPTTVQVHRPSNHQALLAELAADASVLGVLAPPGSVLPTALGARALTLPGVFDPAVVGAWDGTEKDQRLVAVTAHGHHRGGLAQLLAVAAECPTLEFVVAVPASSRSRRLAAFVQQAAGHGNVQIVRTSSVAEAAAVLRPAAFSLHTESPWWLDGPLAAAGSVPTAAAVGCIPLLGPGARAPGFEFGSLSFQDPAHAAQLLAASATWPANTWRDLQRWALDAAWMHHAAPQAMVPVVAQLRDGLAR